MASFFKSTNLFWRTKFEGELLFFFGVIFVHGRAEPDSSSPNEDADDTINYLLHKGPRAVAKEW